MAPINRAQLCSVLAFVVVVVVVPLCRTVAAPIPQKLKARFSAGRDSGRAGNAGTGTRSAGGTGAAAAAGQRWRRLAHLVAGHRGLRAGRIRGLYSSVSNCSL